MITDCYPVGVRRARLQAIRTKKQLDDVDARWATCPFCKSDDECTVEHLLVACPSAALSELRSHMMRRVRVVSDEFMNPLANAAYLGMRPAIGVLTPPMQSNQADPVAEQARRDGWLRIVLGGRSGLPTMTANQARAWGFHVPASLVGGQTVVSVDLASKWDDDLWPAHRYQLTKIRFSTHVVTSEYLLALDSMYAEALEAWLAADS